MDFEIEQCSCDLNEHMKISAILAKCQEISTKHCDSIGMNRDKYILTNTVFLLAKASLQIYSPLNVGEKIHMLTVPSAPVRAVYTRFTRFFNSQGVEVASMDSKWVLVDMSNRKILRNPPDALEFPFIKQSNLAHQFDIPKVSDAQIVGTEKATFSKTDRNQHLNNTQYADIICDALPIDVVSNSNISKIDINYHNEAVLGEIITVSVKQINQNAYYVSGKRQDQKKCFEAGVFFE